MSFPKVAGRLTLTDAGNAIPTATEGRSVGIRATLIQGFAAEIACFQIDQQK